MRAVTVIGIGDDGCLGLSARAANAVAQAQVLVGGERHLAFFPQFSGERIVLKDGLSAALEKVASLSEEHSVCVLASGDPLFFGVGSLLVKKLGREHVEFLPHPSSVQLAFARAGLRWDDATLLSLHGKSRLGFANRLRREAKLAVLTDPDNSPAALARHLLEWNAGSFAAWVCENLGGQDERVRRFASLAELAACADIAPLNVLLLEREGPFAPPPALTALHEDAFAKRMPKKGLITKREARLLSLAALELRPDSVIWDIGAGSGSVGIEAAMIATRGHAHLIEIDPEGVTICRENAQAHGTDNVTVIEGRAPEALRELPDPTAVFIGGSKGSMAEIIEVALERLPAGGRVVANAITLDNVAEAYQAFRARGITPELTVLNVSRGEPLARYLRYEAQNPIHIFAASKPVRREGGAA